MLKLMLICFIAGQLALVSSESWTQYKLVHGKSYENEEEDSMRRLKWENAVEQIKEHNARFDAGLETYRQAINHLADLTEDEMNELLGVERPDDYETYENMPLESEMLDDNLPAEVDWVEKGYVTSVKNQKDCGSCWTFSTCASLEALVKEKYGVLKNLSEQQLVDCCGAKYLGYGCRGGWPPRAFMYTHKYGVESLTLYPYKARQGFCKYNSRLVFIKNNQTWHTTKGTEELLKNWVAHKGVVSVAIQVTDEFYKYTTGVYKIGGCSGKVNHAVAVVGYGSENGEDYWLVKNSWGPNWGLKGYIKMARNHKNMCNIATYPVVGNAM